jgi:hypothetical protein
MSSARHLSYFPWMLSAILSAGSAYGLSPDPKILSLIPHEGQIVSGSGVSTSSAARRKLLIFTPENAADLDDLVALAAVDDSKFIRQIFFVSGRENGNSRVEHSTLAIGQFDQARIYRAAIQNGAQIRDYRGLEILELHPFSRDQRLSQDLLWMAVIKGELALLGTRSNVREELDRYIDHVSPDAALLGRFARLRPEDEMWCLLPDLNHYEDIKRDLGLLDQRFLDAANSGLRFDFGIHYGRRIQFDYESIRTDGDGASVVFNQSREELEGNQGEERLFSESGRRAERGLAHGVISVSKTQYEEWITKIYPGSGRQSSNSGK